ncbi:hypothetical protein KQI69_09850 [Eubacterium sp. MSJ-13]|uniref:hypothetical protein n=1 Tax=Eubacterium sp. MSJ-13 TaxID=2841513 RepID=UPI001C109152|nr:hypothetical protein [Eubacterium sp. MSJ-13]MBU5479505.1 hypothetical protein [Eubacterium sp. MSJ-13]
MAFFFNQATLSHNGKSTVSNITTGEIIEAVKATKTAVIPAYNADSTITYVISLLNSSKADITGLTVTDNLGAYPFDTLTLTPLEYIEGSVKYYIEGVLQADPAVVTVPELIFSEISIPAEGNTTIVYQAAVNEFAPLTIDSTITNTVTIDGETIATPVKAIETITTEDATSLSINKTLSPTTITENGQVTYTFIIQNFGNTAATEEDRLSISDIFNPVLNNIRVTYNSEPWAETGNYTYDTTTGSFETVAGKITVPAASYIQDPVTGAWSVTPGVTTITVTGTI